MRACRRAWKRSPTSARPDASAHPAGRRPEPARDRPPRRVAAGHPGGGGLELAVRYLPASGDIGFSGDWYDVVFAAHPLHRGDRGDIAATHRGGGQDGPGSRVINTLARMGTEHRRALHARPRAARPSGGPLHRHGRARHDRHGPRGAPLRLRRPPAVRAHGARAPRRAARRARRPALGVPGAPITAETVRFPVGSALVGLHRRPRGAPRPDLTAVMVRRSCPWWRCRCARVAEPPHRALRSGEPLW